MTKQHWKVIGGVLGGIGVVLIGLPSETTWAEVLRPTTIGGIFIAVRTAVWALNASPEEKPDVH